MKTHNRILNIVFIFALVISACAPIAVATETHTTEPTATTIVPSPTPRPEINVALKKPVRVSANWIAEPPERAVDGNPNNWWGAGGPVPQWIEVDLEGIYSVSRIRIINEGPTGIAPYQVYGRGPDNVNRLLHVFEGYKSNNQKLEFAPESPWEDISTIRIEINSGSGWVGFREIQIFTREDPKPLPMYAEDETPLFLAQVDPASLEPISADNAIFMEQLATIGRGPINQLAWAPDGKTLAAAGPLGIWLYDPSDLQAPPRLLEGHTRDVLSVAFSRDGSTTYSASQDGTVKVWDTDSGKLSRTLFLWSDFSYEGTEQNRNLEVWSLAFDPDGNLLAAGALDGTLNLWNLSTGKVQRVLKGHTGSISSLAFSPDGEVLVSSGGRGEVFVWDVETGAQRADLSSQQMSEQRLATAPQGDLLAIAHSADQPLQLYDTATGKETAQLKDHTQVISLDFSPNGLMLATSGLNSRLQIWDAQSRESRVISENAGWITNLTFSPDGTSLASISWQGVLQLWDVSSGVSVDSQIGHTRPVTSISFSPDGKLLASGGEDGVIWVWDVEANSLAMVFLGHFSSVTGLAFSPDGKLLASSSFDNTVRLWDTRSVQQIAVLSGHESYVRCVAFSPDGKTVASGGTDSTVRLWDAVTGEERAMLAGHSGEVESLSFSPDGNWLVSASADKSLRLWNVTTGKESSVLQGHLSPALGVAFSPDGSTLASVGQDFYMRLWKWEVASGIATARQSASPRGHAGSVLSVAFSPNGDIVADASMSTWSYNVAPGEIHLYSADTAYPYVMLRGHTKRVTSIAFSPDGKLLASGSTDGSIRLWGIQQKGSELVSQAVAVTPTPRTNIAADPFSGVWKATDPLDGSSLTMEITLNENNYTIAYVDDGASVCGKNSAGNPMYGIEIELSGNASGDVLYAVSTSATCLSSPASPLELEISVNYSHQADTDTLRDSMDNTQWERRPPSSGQDDFNESLTEVWHRINSDQRNPTPEHEVLSCERGSEWNCSYYKQAEPALAFENPPDSTTGSFSGQDVTGNWVCPGWFPSAICNNLKFVASGVMSLKLSDGGEFAGSQDLIITDQGGERVLYLYWTEQGLYCPWYEELDTALAANPFPNPFNGQDWPLVDCNQAHVE